MKKIGILIPAYNEENMIIKVINRVNTELANKFDFRILVIDDGSEDKTSQLVRKQGVELARHPVSMGPGGALRTGYMIMKNWDIDYIVQLDADGQHDPADFHQLYQKMIEEHLDMVVGSRFLIDDPDLSFVRKFGITFFTWLINFLTGLNLTDITSGFRVLTSGSLEKVCFSSEKHWTIEMTLLAYKNDLKMGEAPMKVIERENGVSQFNELITFFTYPFRVIKQILMVYLM